MKKRALVTGCCGFIGSNLTHRLVNDGWVVDGVDDMSNGHLDLLDDTKFRVVPSALVEAFEASAAETRTDDTVLVIQGDFADPLVLKRIISGRYDVVFHLAANPRVEYSVKHPVVTTDINVLRTVSLFTACATNVRRVVFSSSSSVYGDSDALPTKETAATSPESPYALQKLIGEDYAKLFSKLYDLDIICLRYFNVFGPRQYGDSPYSTAISAWCDAVAHDKFLRSDGDGTQSRDLVYVDDVVDANVLAASATGKFNGDHFNIATGERYTNNQILEYFQEQFSHVAIRHAPARPGDVMHTQADIEKAGSAFGYYPKTSFWEGLKRTMQWWGLYEQ